jgi:hypothetical protein
VRNRPIAYAEPVRTLRPQPSYRSRKLIPGDRNVAEALAGRRPPSRRKRSSAITTAGTCMQQRGVLVIVFSFESSDAVTTTESTLSPAATMALGAIALVAAFVLVTGRHHRAAERRRARGGKERLGPAEMAAGAREGLGADYLRRRSIAHTPRRVSQQHGTSRSSARAVGVRRKHRC